MKSGRDFDRIDIYFSSFANGGMIGEHPPMEHASCWYAKLRGLIRLMRSVPVGSRGLLSSRVLQLRAERREVVVEGMGRLEDGKSTAVAHNGFRFI